MMNNTIQITQWIQGQARNRKNRKEGDRSQGY